ncbi:MAG TPA: WxL domain-containing protein [Patescibacteria group bacterium]|nr:WxL domain-containing protein [Patescibacteria group bacterium]
MDKNRAWKRITLSVGASALLVGTIAAPAFAADTVTQAVTAGTRSASVADLTLASVAYSHSGQSSTGSMTLTADDSSGSGAGWNVTIISSAFVYSGSNGGTNIAASNFSLTSAATPVQTAGQAVDTTDGPYASVTSGALNAARKTVAANAGFGQGTYTQALGVSLTIPAQSRVGTYTGTLTTTISAAP